MEDKNGQLVMSKSNTKVLQFLTVQKNANSKQGHFPRVFFILKLKKYLFEAPF